MKRVLLINPYGTDVGGFSNPPLGLLYLAGTLLKHGYQVRIIDGCHVGKDGVQQGIKEFAPQIVGITCLTPGRVRAIEVARMVKQFNRDILVVLGGVHATIMYRQILDHYPDIDYVVLGEGEQTLLELAQGLSLQNIDGLVFRQNGIVVKTKPRENCSNLDDISFPAWHLIDLKRYPGRGEGKHNGIVLIDTPRIPIIFSRGCSGHCDFCSTWWIWKGWRHRSAINMADELEMLYRDHGIRHFCFADDAMTVDRQATIELCDEIIRRNMVISFHVTTRTDSVDEKMLLKLKQAGCYMIAFGIETGSPRLLKEMGKENDIDNSIRAISHCRKIKLPVTAFLIVGNIGETKETVRETRDLLKRAMPDEVGCAGALLILPGTKLYQDCRRKGVIDDDFWLGEEPYMAYTLEHSLETLGEFTRTINNYKGFLRATFEKAERLPKIFRKIRRIMLAPNIIQIIPRFKNWLMVVADPELRDLRRVINCSAFVSQNSTLATDCDQIYIQRLRTAPKALKMFFWENHFEWKVVREYPEIRGHILDFGCGSGHSDILLARKGYKLHGVDLSPIGIAIATYLIAKENAEIRERLSFEVADVTKTRTTQILFDSAWSSHVFEHIADPTPILHGLKSWLKPWAHLLISVPLGYAYDDPGHVNHFANGEELQNYLGEMVTVIRIDISREFQVIRALCILR